MAEQAARRGHQNDLAASPCAASAGRPRAPSASFCVTFASITSRKRSGAMSTILDTSFLPEATTRMSTPAETFGRALTISSQAASTGARATISSLAPSCRHSAATLGELFGFAGRQHELRAGGGQCLGGDGAEGAGRAGDDRDLASDRKASGSAGSRPHVTLHPRRIGDDDQHLADIVCRD